MKITVIGMGKIGLPLAVQFALKGHKVIGLDIDSSTVNSINSRIEPFPNEKNLQENLEKVVFTGLLEATTDSKYAISSAEAIVVVVPLFVDEKANPNFDAMDSVTCEIAKFVQKGALVSYETTLPIGTTRNRFAFALERDSGLKIGSDIFVVFSPERVLTGRIFSDLRKYPKVIGGVTEACTNLGVQFYESVLDFDARPDLNRPNGVWKMDSCEAAEFVKLAETTYRDVNIGLANQFAKYADSVGINVIEVIEASNSQHFSHIHKPGIAVGGHCIPIYPQFYIWNDPQASIVQAARNVNISMPRYAVELIAAELKSLKGARILILGASYRTGVKETAFSGALELNKLLIAGGATVAFVDPLFTQNELERIGLNYFDGDLSEIDAIILQTDDEAHSDFLRQNLPSCKIVVDGRNSVYDAKLKLKLNIVGIGAGATAVLPKNSDISGILGI